MKPIDPDLIPSINQSLEINLPGNISEDELKEKISSYINTLIENDFHRLVSLLYRVDVSEEKLKTMLIENQGTDAGKIIGELIIERQLQKIKTRRDFNRRDSTISDEEAW